MKRSRFHFLLGFGLLVAMVLTTAMPAFSATVVIDNQDRRREGFNDNTPAAPVGGNSGTTIGEQRLIVFERAAEIWGGILRARSRLVKALQSISYSGSRPLTRLQRRF